jgi:hypothetical protein
MTNELLSNHPAEGDLVHLLARPYGCTILLHCTATFSAAEKAGKAAVVREAELTALICNIMC